MYTHGPAISRIVAARAQKPTQSEPGGVLSKLAPLGQTVISIPKETAAVLSVFNSPRDETKTRGLKRRKKEKEKVKEKKSGEKQGPRHVYGYRHGRVVLAAF